MATETDTPEPEPSALEHVPAARAGVRRRSLLTGTVIAVVAVAAAAAAAVAAAGFQDEEGTAPPEPEAELRFLPEDDESDQALLAEDQTGEVVPDDSFPLLDGGLGTFADFAGKPVVVNFFASWCEPCKAELPDFAMVHDELGEQVTFVGVNVRDSEDDARLLLEATGVDYTVARDPSGALAEAFGVINMPSTFILDAEGRVVSSHPGVLTAGELRAELAGLG